MNTGQPVPIVSGIGAPAAEWIKTMVSWQEVTPTILQDIAPSAATIILRPFASTPLLITSGLVVITTYTVPTAEYIWVQARATAHIPMTPGSTTTQHITLSNVTAFLVAKAPITTITTPPSQRIWNTMPSSTLSQNAVQYAVPTSVLSPMQTILMTTLMACVMIAAI